MHSYIRYMPMYIHEPSRIAHSCTAALPDQRAGPGRRAGRIGWHGTWRGCCVYNERDVRGVVSYGSGEREGGREIGSHIHTHTLIYVLLQHCVH